MRRTRMSRVLAGLFAAALVVVFSGNAGAEGERWKYLGADSKHTQLFYDAASVICISMDSVRVWTRELTGAAPVKRLREVNCSGKVIRDLQIITEKPGTPPVILARPSQWLPMEAEPTTNQLYKEICK